VNLDIYAEVKDDAGNVVPYVNIMGYLHPLEEEGCLKRVGLSYDDYIKRYTTTAYLQQYECPPGVYMLEITASRTSYGSAKVEESVLINYTEGYEYSVLLPPAIGILPPVCKEVSCGPECVQKVCSTTTPVEQCAEEVVDKDCIRSCKDKATAVEESASKGTAAAFDLDSCVASCTKNIPCRGSNVTSASNDEMMKKLDDIHKEVSETKGTLQEIRDMLAGLIDFLKSLFASRFMTAAPQIATTTTTMLE
jgi:hypothetical protein